MLDILRADRIIVHGYYLWWIPVAVLFAHMRGIPVFLMPHGSLTEFDRRKSTAKKTLFRYALLGWLVDRVSKFLVASEVEKQELPQSVARRNVIVVGAGAEHVDAEMRTKPHAPLRLLTLSRVAPKKRIDLCIESVEALRVQGIEATLTVVGAGDSTYEAELRGLAASLRLMEHVRFVGQATGRDKRDWLRKSDIFLLPSDDENFGLAFAEASMFGLPAIVSDRVGAASALPAAAGARLRLPTPASIAQAVQAIMANYAVASTETRSFAEREFAWPVVAQRWERAIRSYNNGNTS
jgi:glycosyltransferase involved in cell wall biosynthesis